MMLCGNRLFLLKTSFACFLFLLFVLILQSQSPQTYLADSTQGGPSIASGKFSFDRQSPLIFVGGVPRSGTTLMRALLDAHGDIRCGEETHLIPASLKKLRDWTTNTLLTTRLAEAGIDGEIIMSAAASFVLGIVVGHGEPAERLCNKDPMTFGAVQLLSEMFEKARFIFMIRDGRAVVHSLISRGVVISGFNASGYREGMMSWNKLVSKMNAECESVGWRKCMKVHYEQLVLHPESTMRNILEFLDVRWDDAVLRHEEFINKPGGISLSRWNWLLFALREDTLLKF